MVCQRKALDSGGRGIERVYHQKRKLFGLSYCVPIRHCSAPYRYPLFLLDKRPTNRPNDTPPSLSTESVSRLIAVQCNNPSLLSSDNNARRFCIETMTPCPTISSPTLEQTVPQQPPSSTHQSILERHRSTSAPQNAGYRVPLSHGALRPEPVVGWQTIRLGIFHFPRPSSSSSGT